MVVAGISKVSQLAGYGGSIVSRIIEIESKSKIYFEHAHMSTKKIENSRIEINGLNMVLECDKLTKEERWN